MRTEKFQNTEIVYDRNICSCREPLCNLFRCCFSSCSTSCRTSSSWASSSPYVDTKRERETIDKFVLFNSFFFFFCSLYWSCFKCKYANRFFYFKHNKNLVFVGCVARSERSVWKAIGNAHAKVFFILKKKTKSDNCSFVIWLDDSLNAQISGRKQSMENRKLKSQPPICVLFLLLRKIFFALRRAGTQTRRACAVRRRIR